MPTLSVDQVRESMDVPRRIRHITVLNGLTSRHASASDDTATFCDSLIAQFGIIKSYRTCQRYMSTRQDSREAPPMRPGYVSMQFTDRAAYERAVKDALEKTKQRQNENNNDDDDDDGNDDPAAGVLTNFYGSHGQFQQDSSNNNSKKKDDDDVKKQSLKQRDFEYLVNLVDTTKLQESLVSGDSSPSAASLSMLSLIDGAIVLVQPQRPSYQLPATSAAAVTPSSSFNTKSLEHLLPPLLCARVRPLIVVDKLDSLIIEGSTPDEALEAIDATLDRVSKALALFPDRGSDETVDAARWEEQRRRQAQQTQSEFYCGETIDLAPEVASSSSSSGNFSLGASDIVFSAGPGGWSFNVGQFAKMYAARLHKSGSSSSSDQLQQKLMKEYFDPKTGKFSKTAVPEEQQQDDDDENGQKSKHPPPPLRRAFSVLVLEPIFKLFTAVCDAVDCPTAQAEQHTHRLEQLLQRIAVHLPSLRSDLREKNFTAKKLFRAVMQKWLSGMDAVMDAVVHKLPSPVHAQRYRAETLYAGPSMDKFFAAFSVCGDPVQFAAVAPSTAASATESPYTSPATASGACFQVVPDGDVDHLSSHLPPPPPPPLLVGVAKMFQLPDRGRFGALCRVFSGSVAPGNRVRILQSGFQLGAPDRAGGGGGNGNKVVENKAVQRVVVSMGWEGESVDSVGPGNLCVIIGLDMFITSSGTLTDVESLECGGIAPFFASSPATATASPGVALRCCLSPKVPSDLPVLVEATKRARREWMHDASIMSDDGQMWLGAGSSKQLRELVRDVCDASGGRLTLDRLVVGEPVVSLRETVIGDSMDDGATTATDCGGFLRATSPNMHNRIWARCGPLAASSSSASNFSSSSSPSFVDSLARGDFEDLFQGSSNNNNYADPKLISAVVDRFPGSHRDDVDNGRLWAFAPQEDAFGKNLCPTNALFNNLRDHQGRTSGATRPVPDPEAAQRYAARADTIDYATKKMLDEIQDAVIAGLNWTCREGVLCGGGLHGVRWNLDEVVLHSDSIHRGAGQMIPCARKALTGTFLRATPRILEPLIQVEILVSAFDADAVVDPVLAVMDLIAERDGTILSERLFDGSPSVLVTASLPAAAAFGLAEALEEELNSLFPQQQHQQPCVATVLSSWHENGSFRMIEGDPLAVLSGGDAPAAAAAAVPRSKVRHTPQRVAHRKAAVASLGERLLAHRRSLQMRDEIAPWSEYVKPAFPPWMGGGGGGGS